MNDFFMPFVSVVLPYNLHQVFQLMEKC